MLKLSSLSLIALVTLFCSGIPRAQATNGAPRATQFSSVYTNLNSECKNAFKESEVNEGSDMPLRCTGYGGYYIYIWYSAWASQIAVQMKGNEDVSIFLAMQPLNYSDEKGRKIEWRMADGKPFAVIARISNYSDKAGADGGNPFDPKYKTGESLVVKGLKGYENIDGTIDAKTPDANAKARQLADEKYKR